MAKELGKSIRELFDSMSIYEFQMWITYYNEYPFGDYRTDLREALNCAALLAPQSKRRLSIKDFLLIKDDSEEEKNSPSTKEVVNKCMRFFGVIK